MVWNRAQFWVEIGNEQGLSDSLIHDVVAVSGAMQRKAKDLKLPFNLSFVVGGNGWVPKAFSPMMEALAPGSLNSCMPLLCFLGMNHRGLDFHLIYILFMPRLLQARRRERMYRIGILISTLVATHWMSQETGGC